MKLRFRKMLAFFTGLMMLFAGFCFAVGEAQEGSGTIIYKPPFRGAPGSRQGAGTRKPNSPVCVLAPDHVGLTTKSQPTLYWYLFNTAKNKIEFTLIDEMNGQIVIQTPIPNPNTKGLQQLNLADYKVQLSPGKEYRWSISIWVDLEGMTINTFQEYIMRVEPSKSLTDKINRAKKSEIPIIYAEEGYWYDALTALSQLIQHHPNNILFQQQRIQLFEQVELKDVAKYERQELEKIEKRN